MFNDTLLLKTLSNKKVGRPPVWFMRQAGRYLPEYRLVREKAGSFWNLCFNPELAAEVTLQPLERFNFDAAIIFSDILVIPHALGQKVDFKPDHGPILEEMDWKILQATFENQQYHQKLQPTYDSLTRVKEKLMSTQTLIGFSGAPWTLATYMINLGKSETFEPVLNLLKEKPEFFLEILDLLAVTVADYLIYQINAGAEVVKIFDSWASVVPEKERKKVILDPLKKIVTLVRKRYPDIKIIYFGRKIASFYKEILKEIPELALAFDQDVDPINIRDQYQAQVPVQGNLDPNLLLRGGQELIDQTYYLLETLGQGPYIFNLGHGILPQTPPAHVAQVVNLIQNYKN